MARGRERRETRNAALSALGKSLTRRAGSVCELCGGSGDLRPHEIPPVEEDPQLDRALLACERCRSLIDGGRLPEDLAELRFLETAVWAELLPVQLAAVRLLRRLDAPWAREANEGLWLGAEVEALL